MGLLRSPGNFNQCLKIGEEKAKQNTRPILVMADSGGRISTEGYKRFFFSKSKLGVKSLKVEYLVSGPLGIFNIYVSVGYCS